MVSMRFFLTALAVCWSLALLQPTMAQTATVSSSIANSLAANDGLGTDPGIWLSQLDLIELEIEDEATIEPGRLSDLSSELTRIQRQARTAIDEYTRQLLPVQRELTSLGDKPDEEGIAESVEEQALRTGLQERVVEFQRQIRLSRLAAVRAENLQGRVSELEFGLITLQGLLRPTPSLFDSSTWRIAIRNADEYVQDLLTAPSEWWKRSSTLNAVQPLILLGISIAVALVSLFLRRRLQDLTESLQSRLEPNYTSRIAVAFIIGIAEILLPGLTFGVAAAGVYVLGNTDILLPALLLNVLIAALFFSVAAGLSYATLQPDKEAWRLIQVDDRRARNLHRRVEVLWFVLGLAYVIIETADVSGAGTPAFYTVATTLSDTIIVVLLLGLLPHRFVRTEDGSAHPVAVAVSVLMVPVLIAIPVLDFVGYARLASYLLGYLVATVLFTGLAILIRLSIGEGLAWLVDPRRGLRNRFRKGDRQGGELPAYFRITMFLIVDVVIYGSLIWLLLLVYGFPSSQINLWLGRFAEGIKLGNVTISPVDIAVAILVFAAVVIATNFARRGLASQLSQASTMDVGLRNAIVSGVGYVGLTIATIAGIGALGLDLSNFALVASALSVGVGFGLRTIVENFVAGLILLIERPVKEGDWIVIGGRDGIVKNISVRSTEVETFDRSRIVVPNSELVGQSVENWNHRNRLARVIIPVGVAYGSDTERVRRELLECAKGHPDVLTYPAPQVFYLEFGASSLNFELRVFVRDTDLYMIVKSDLHFAIDAAFREAGIEIPFPQSVVHMAAENNPPDTAEHLLENAVMEGKQSRPA